MMIYSFYWCGKLDEKKIYNRFLDISYTNMVDDKKLKLKNLIAPGFWKTVFVRKALNVHAINFGRFSLEWRWKI